METGKQLHQVVFTKTEDGHTLAFTCLGDKTSKCHQYPDCGCDFWDDNHEHPKTAHDDCWLVSWFSGDSASYVGEDAITNCPCREQEYCPPATRTGFIDAHLSDDWVEWEWR